MAECDILLDRIRANVEKDPSKNAVFFLQPGPDGGKVQKSLTYQQLWDETEAIAALLADPQYGLEKGDRVVLVYPPSLDFMIAFLACLRLGVIAVPVFPPNPNRRDTLQMFAKIVQGCSPKLALTNGEYNHLKKLSGLKDAFTKFKRQPTASWPENLKWVATDKASKPSNPPDIVPSTRSDTAFLQYTSGSTSEPKGVMITHGNLAHNLTIITNELKAVEDTVVVSWLPQYHDMGLIGSYLGCLYCGGTGYYLSPLSFLQRPMVWIEAVSKYKATHLQAPNFAFKLTARKFEAKNYSPETLNLSSVRHVINAAEPVDEDSIETFYAKFGPFGFGKVIFPTYGLAEHTVFVCSGGKQILSVNKEALETQGKVTLVDGSKGDAAISRLVGCGFPESQAVDVRIVDHESMKQLEEDVVGEIWIKSSSKAAGYFHKPEETKHDFHGQLEGTDPSEEEDGYLRTGDLGFLHNKELFICGRLKDLIIVGGRNYYPQDIEASAEGASDLVRPGCSAAFTVDQTKGGGEEVALVMELKEVPSNSKEVEMMCAPLADEIRAAVNQEHSLGLAEIVFLQTRSVPKTSSGKIARSWCRKGFIAGTLKVVFRKNFREGVQQMQALEIESNPTGMAPASAPTDPSAIRNMSKQDILDKLVKDVSRVGSIPPESINTTAPLVTLMDSLSLSQFKGLFENHYASKISDEYMFRESTTLTKLADVAKLGYAPDDGEGNEGSGSGGGSGAVGGKAEGLAGALGCPPGVRCAIM